MDGSRSGWRCFRVPRKKCPGGLERAPPQAFIGVIDASGSMRHCWCDVAKMYNRHRPVDQPCVTITFDGKPRICPSNSLSDNIREHGGGLTNISKAFEVLDEKLSEMSTDTHVTCLFISDGADSDSQSLEARLQELKGNCGRQVTFICLGIKSAFPTFISMYLRELYHNTQSSIPALFLIEHASERAFFNKFEVISRHFTRVEKMRVEPPCWALPWMPATNEVYEDQVILTQESSLRIDGAKHELCGCSLSADHLAELFRGYVQELELLGLGPTKHMLKEYACKALELMMDLLEDFKASSGVDFLSGEDCTHLDGMGLSLWEGLQARATANVVRHSKIKVGAYVENVRAMASGHDARQMDQYDAAKRIGVGTITGKQVQKALALKEVPLAEFARVKEDFGLQLRSLHGKAGLFKGERGALQTQRGVLEADSLESMLQGLDMVKSQFDLWETLPLCGVALLVKRHEGIQGDPWRLTVKRILQAVEPTMGLNGLLTTTSSPMAREYFKQDTQGYVCQVEGQEANCVLPLYHRDDADLEGIAQHPLMHILIGCNVTLNADGFHTEAYAALLASTFVAMLGEKKLTDEAQAYLLRSLRSSAALALGGAGPASLGAYGERLRQDPAGAVSAAVSQDLSKPLFHLYVMHERGDLTAELAGVMFDAMGTAYFSRCMQAGSLADVLSLDVPNDPVFKMAEEKLRSSFRQCYSLGDLHRLAKRAVSQMAFQPQRGNHALVVKAEKLREEDSKVNLRVLEEFARLVHLPELTDERLLLWISCAYKGSAGGPRASEPAALIKCLLKDPKETFSDELFAAVRSDFIDEFKRLHCRLLPISKARLKKECQDRGIDAKKFVWDRNTCLVRNACMAPDCPFFLERRQGNFIRHLGTWCHTLPRAFHKTVRAYAGKDPAFVLAKFVSGDRVKGKVDEDLNLSDFEASKEWVLEYIEEVMQAYAEIDAEEAGWELA